MFVQYQEQWGLQTTIQTMVCRPTGPDTAQTCDLARPGQYDQQESQVETSMSGVTSTECPYWMW